MSVALFWPIWDIWLLSCNVNRTLFSCISLQSGQNLLCHNLVCSFYKSITLLVRPYMWVLFIQIGDQSKEMKMPCTQWQCNRKRLNEQAVLRFPWKIMISDVTRIRCHQFVSDLTSACMIRLRSSDVTVHIIKSQMCSARGLERRAWHRPLTMVFVSANLWRVTIHPSILSSPQI